MLDGAVDIMLTYPDGSSNHLAATVDTDIEGQFQTTITAPTYLGPYELFVYDQAIDPPSILASSSFDVIEALPNGLTVELNCVGTWPGEWIITTTKQGGPTYLATHVTANGGSQRLTPPI